ENVAVGRIDNYDRSSLCPRFQSFFGKLLQAQVQSCNNVISRNGRLDQSLGSLVAVFVERQFVFAVFADEQLIESLFDSFPAFRLWPQGLVVVDDPLQVAASLASVADDLAGEFSVWISSDIDRANNQKILRMVFDRLVLGLAQVLRDFQRQNAAIVVMPQD